MQKQAILRRLLFTKYLLRLASQEVQRPEPFCASGLLLLHDSVELILALACEHHNVGSKRTEFMTYFDLLKNVIQPGELAHRESMRRLNDARVGLKHHGTMPSRREILGFDVAVSDFVSDNLRQLLGVDLADVSLADLISSDSVKGCLKRAERALEELHTDEASGAIAEAFARLLDENEVTELSPRALQFDFNRLESGSGDAYTISLATKKLAEAVAQLHQEVALMRLGIDTRKLTVFRALTPSVMIATAGNAHLMRAGGRRSPTAQEMRFCYNFVIDSALQIEDVVSVVSDIAIGRHLRSHFGSI